MLAGKVALFVGPFRKLVILSEIRIEVWLESTTVIRIFKVAIIFPRKGDGLGPKVRVSVVAY